MAIINGNSSNNTLFGTSGDDTINGYGGNDTITDGLGNDTVRGGAGNDIIHNLGGSDRFFGGTGIDTLVTDVTAFAVQSFEVVFNTVTGVHGRKDSTLGQDTIAGIENFTLIGDFNAYATGGAGANVFRTDLGADELRGGGGADRLYSGAGNDYLYGDAGHDRLYGGAGDDELNGGTGNDRLYGGTGNDRLIGGAGTNHLYGGAGYDYLYGGTGIDRMFGGAGNDRLYGGQGNDYLVAGDGDDRLYGGEDNDTLVMNGSGAQVFDGGTGVDTLMAVISGLPTDMVIGVNLITGVSGAFGVNHPLNDEVYNIENVVWQGANDMVLVGDGARNLLSSGSGADILRGNGGNDVLRGGSGADRLFGGAGADRLFGGAGADRLFGGAGRDIMYAGNDATVDRFVFRAVNDTASTRAGADRIFQFDTGEDLIVLSQINADTSTGTNDAFAFSTTGAAANSIWIEISRSDSFINGDVDGDGIADFQIGVIGVTDLTIDDFIL